jgi:ATP-dependent DNA helicase PIF1
MDEGDVGQFKLLNKMCPANEVFKLKLNAQVILLKNLDVAGHLVNGARGCVVGFTESKLPIVKFLNGKKVTIKYESWSFKINAAGQMATRRQLPLQLAWAISIHKSQGMTLDCVEISLSRVFEFGQAYVALSRAKSLQTTKILDFDASAIRADETVLKYYEKIARKNANSF